MAARHTSKAVHPVTEAMTDRLRRDRRLARLIEPVLAIGVLPLRGRRISVRSGVGRGIVMLGERHAAVWLLGTAERPVQRLLERSVGDGDVVFDVGASVGFFTLLAARLVHPTGHVVAFEPDPRSRRSLAANVEANTFENVTIVPAALSDRTGAALLSAGSRPTARLVHPTDEQAGRAVAVTTTSLDAFVDDHPQLAPTLVKIDVEGHEAAVLDGMLRTLSHHRPVVIIEAHGTGADVARLLRQCRYAVTLLDSATGVEQAPIGTHLVGMPMPLGPGG